MTARAVLQFALLSCVAVLGGCSRSPGTALDDAPNQQVFPANYSAGMVLQLPLPSQLPAKTRTVSISPDIVRSGSEFETTLPNCRVETAAPCVTFSPDWSGPTAGIDKLAYCMYEYYPVGYDRAAQIRCRWATPPDAVKDVWIGLANWGKDRWDWYPVAGDEPIDVGSFAQYFDEQSSNRCVAVVVCSGNSTVQLRYVCIGSTPPVPAIVVSQTTGPSPITVTFDPADSYDPDTADEPTTQIVKYEWDLEPDGVYELATEAPEVQSHEYSTSAPGATFAPMLRVTDDYGVCASAAVSIEVVNGWQHSQGRSETDEFAACVQDESGNIFAIGTTEGNPYPHTNLLLVKFGPDGTLSWKKCCAIPLWHDRAYRGNAIALDGAGNLIVVGVLEDLDEGTFDALIQQWDPDGNLLQTLTWGGELCEAAENVVATSSGIYICGTVDHHPDWDNTDVFFLKLDSTWSLEWQYIWETPGGESLGGMVQSSSVPEMITAVGTTYDLAGIPNGAFSFDFDSSGNLSQLCVLSGLKYLTANAVAADGLGNLYIVGSSYQSLEASMLFYKLDAERSLVFATEWQAQGDDDGTCIVLSGDGRALVGGCVGSWNAAVATFDSASGAFGSAKYWGDSLNGPSSITGMIRCPYGGYIACGISEAVDGYEWSSIAGTSASTAGAVLTKPPFTASAASSAIATRDTQAEEVPGTWFTDSGGGGDNTLLLYQGF